MRVEIADAARAGRHPGLRTTDGIAKVVGHYPSAGGGGEPAAWFRDTEGNLHGIGQAIR